MGDQDVNKDVSDNRSDMLEMESQIHKENDDLTPENDVENDAKNIVTNNPENNISNFKNRKSATKGKKAHAVEDMEKDVNDNLKGIDVPMNKKSNDIVTRNKEQLISQDYA
ncbi:unnamed protein product [Vicia faba]|uniref:Uncharacterized protein n=1 Tax=Vicia faba TaxID=3906 RepID=A0AAV0ZZU8_VICFA|nr:unnamed protein product [Vicia faba]